ncbi:hypothetical protein NHJ13051_002660 [Beauveria bassiana]
MSQDAFKLGSSVYHHSKKTCSCSSYVSISASKDKATNFASKQTVATSISRRPKQRTLPDKTKFSEARKAAEWARLSCSSLKRKRAGAPAGCDHVKNPAAEGEEASEEKSQTLDPVPNKTFRDKMNSTFVAEAALVIADMSDSIAVTNTTGQIAMDNSKDLTGERVNYSALHQTLQVAKLLRGALGGDEAKLDMHATAKQSGGLLTRLRRRRSPR